MIKELIAKGICDSDENEFVQSASNCILHLLETLCDIKANNDLHHSAELSDEEVCTIQDYTSSRLLTMVVNHLMRQVVADQSTLGRCDAAMTTRIEELHFHSTALLEILGHDTLEQYLGSDRYHTFIKYCIGNEDKPEG